MRITRPTVTRLASSFDSKLQKFKWKFPNDIDKDGVPNLKDCEPFNPYRQDPRYLEKKVDGSGLRIMWPDGREIALLQDNKQEFIRYIMDMAYGIGLQPNPNTMQFHIGNNPSRIVITW